MAPIPVCHGGKWDRSNGSCQIHLDHAAVDDKHDTDGKGVHGKSHEKGLEPQTEQFSRAQGFKLRLHIRDDAADINGGISDDDACAAVYNALPHIEDTHDDIPCVRHNENGAEGLENRKDVRIREESQGNRSGTWLGGRPSGSQSAEAATQKSRQGCAEVSWQKACKDAAGI